MVMVLQLYTAFSIYIYSNAIYISICPCPPCPTLPTNEIRKQYKEQTSTLGTPCPTKDLMILSPFPVARDLLLVVEMRRGCCRIGEGGGGGGWHCLF